MTRARLDDALAIVVIVLVVGLMLSVAIGGVP